MSPFRELNSIIYVVFKQFKQNDLDRNWVCRRVGSFNWLKFQNKTFGHNDYNECVLLSLSSSCVTYNNVVEMLWHWNERQIYAILLRYILHFIRALWIFKSSMVILILAAFPALTLPASPKNCPILIVMVWSSTVPPISQIIMEQWILKYLFELPLAQITFIQN